LRLSHPPGPDSFTVQTIPSGLAGIVTSTLRVLPPLPTGKPCSSWHIEKFRKANGEQTEQHNVAVSPHRRTPFRLKPTEGLKSRTLEKDTPCDAPTIGSHPSHEMAKAST
jgi:hypothetical protein